MSDRNRLLVSVFIALILLSSWGVFRLFTLRFEKGDMFPPYSSLRSDPLGSKAFYEALGESGIAAGRNYRDLAGLKGIKGETIYYPGAEESLLAPSADGRTRELEALAKEGNRLVIAFAPVRGEHSPAAKRSGIHSKGEDGDKSKESTGKEEEESCDCRTGAWGITITPAGPDDKAPHQALLALSDLGLPRALPFRFRNRFRSENEAWQRVYGYGAEPVVLERTFGKGSIVLLADSYPLSNEAMRKDRQPVLLAWLQGANRAALFDESHLGVRDDPGVMTLIRKHRLVPFLIALLTLAALYVWMCAVPLVTMPPPGEGGTTAGGRDNFNGLVNLLRRNIAPADLLVTCFREWSASSTRDYRRFPLLGEQVSAIVAGDAAKPPAKRDPVARYREIADILAAHRGVPKKADSN